MQVRAKQAMARFEDDDDEGQMPGEGKRRRGAAAEDVEDDPLYQAAASKSRGKKVARAEKYSAPAMPPPLEDEMADGPRKVSRVVEQNRGLTPHRRKDTKNPRVKVCVRSCLLWVPLEAFYPVLKNSVWDVPVWRSLTDKRLHRAGRGSRKQISGARARSRMSGLLLDPTVASRQASRLVLPRVPGSRHCLRVLCTINFMQILALLVRRVDICSHRLACQRPERLPFWP